MSRGKLHRVYGGCHTAMFTAKEYSQKQDVTILSHPLSVRTPPWLPSLPTVWHLVLLNLRRKKNNLMIKPTIKEGKTAGHAGSATKRKHF